jgi:hypothetical protein
MLNLIDPATTDLLFTLTATMGLLGAAVITLWALPWTDTEIAATEATADGLLRLSPRPARIRTSR